MEGDILTQLDTCKAKVVFAVAAFHVSGQHSVVETTSVRACAEARKALQSLLGIAGPCLLQSSP